MRVDQFARQVVVDDDTATVLQAAEALDLGRLVGTGHIARLIRMRATRANQRAGRLIHQHGMREALIIDQAGTVLGKAVAYG